MSDPEADHGGEPSPTRGDLELWRQALRNDWPIPPAVKRRLLQRAINLADPDDEEDIPRAVIDPAERIDMAAKRDRIKLGALRVIAAFAHQNTEQQRLDFLREREAARAKGQAGTPGDAPPRIVIPDVDERYADDEQGQADGPEAREG